ncbi:hypothetical protein H2198_005139 [Neophaeococcomyces mojaviensis]|uniref:Uncharacterized protein n=1 Tax=Neophaeococcomyces mojaviensis TaxID=3383035 RepID=A0ACC3A6X1_9EURO|nr:hypothetical protein H2198_005139 [Knufia sp. JES_112]
MSSQHQSDISEDEFVLVNEDISYRPKALKNDPVLPTNTDVSISLQPILKSNELLVSIQPPEKPTNEFHHTPCDIVLVIDVSGSMNWETELPDNAGTDKKESSGLSILDLVKHAARTVLENLNDGDRLAVVTFSDDATRVQELLPMNQSTKQETWKRIENLQPEYSTNLWSGIREGLDIFNTTDRIGNVQGMFILTDGAPNHMCPTQGYVKKLQPIMRKMGRAKGGAPFLSTFGFGYCLRSDLLQSIAEVGRGKYAFIPDSGMIGTVFVHAVANLFSTFATSVTVSLDTKDSFIKTSSPSYLRVDTDTSRKDMVLHVGNLQYGQSRDIVIGLKHANAKDLVSANLSYYDAEQTQKVATAEIKLSNPPTISQAAIDYHTSRHKLCDFLASLSTRNKNDEHLAMAPTKVEKQANEIKPLIDCLTNQLSAAYKAEASEEDIHNLASLLADLENQDTDTADNPHGAGQIFLALKTDTPESDSSKTLTPRRSHRASSKPSYYERWGKHYLPSILHAHMRQQCTTFKDPGPLCYGSKSPLFIKCRDELDQAFDALPAPKPSLKGQNVHGGVMRMSRYNSRGNPCFAGHCEVKTDDGASGYELRVDELRIGDIVWTSAGGRMVRGIVKTDVTCDGGQMMCNIRKKDSSDEGLWITPYHPVEIDGQWRFPIDIVKNTEKTKKMETGYVYSILLEQDANINAHTINVGGVVCVTLGHGLTMVTDDTADRKEVDVRAHAYFGDYDQISKDIDRLDRDDCRRRISAGVAKDEKLGTATRFLRPDELVQLADSSARKARL